MQTRFTEGQLVRPDIRVADSILRSCVHCGFCTATCPTYVLLGDELDSPRGRIYLIKEMLENDRPASEQVTRHIDRCLSCLSCMTTCPSGVHYMHLVDLARERIEETYRREPADRWLRRILAFVLPRPGLFRLSLLFAGLGRPLAAYLPPRLAAMLALAPRRVAPPSPVDRPQVFPAEGERRARVALLAGCAQQVVAPEINEATVRLLTRAGIEVVIAQNAGCCGALVHHMGRTAESHRNARSNIEAWLAEAERGGLDAVVVNASGCGTTVKDYGHMLRDDEAWAERAARVSAMTRDVTELLHDLGLPPVVRATDRPVAYHSACSMQHGQGLHEPPRALLKEAGFDVREVPEGHLCCGSAGTYNILQPAIAAQLRDRKAGNIARTGASLVATGNVGCITQLDGALGIAVVHTIELLDWATGGPRPLRLSDDP